MVKVAGTATALSEAVDAAGPPVLQPALFPADQIELLPDGPERAPELRRRAGRPVGAVNKRSAVFRDYVLARGEHPVDGLIEAYSRSVHDLAAELGCTRLEAFRLQLDARRVVLEYVEGKQPVSVNVNGGGGIAVIFEGFGQADKPVLDGEYFQELSSDPDQGVGQP